MKTEKREKHNKEREDIVKSLDEILAALNRIEAKLYQMIGENPIRLNEDLNRGFLAYNAAGELVYVPYGNIATRCANQIDGIREDFNYKED